MHSDCYCPLGVFYSENSRRSPLSPQWQDVPFVLEGDHAGLCQTRGEVVWRGWYFAYASVAWFSFFCLSAWYFVRLICPSQSASPSARLSQKLIHSFGILAAFVRMFYLTNEALLVHHYFDNDADHMDFWQRMAECTYSSFFPLSATAFLFACQHWQVMICLMDGVPEYPRHRDPFVGACVLILLVEVLHWAWYFLHGRGGSLDSAYFFWLSVVSVVVSLVGVVVARRLYMRLREVVADDGSKIFQRVMVSSVVVSALSIIFLFLSIVQAMYGRFYAWPCFACWVTGRLLEVIYLYLILSAVGRGRRPRQATHSWNSPGLQANSSFTGSMVYNDTALPLDSQFTGQSSSATAWITSTAPTATSPSPSIRRWLFPENT